MSPCGSHAGFLLPDASMLAHTPCPCRLQIFEYLPMVSRCRLRQVCRRLRDIGHDGVLWRRLSWQSDVARAGKIKKNRFEYWLSVMMSQDGFSTGLRHLDLAGSPVQSRALEHLVRQDFGFQRTCQVCGLQLTHGTSVFLGRCLPADIVDGPLARDL